ncbi:MAG: helix-turn-helix domain-containing protein [archaeon]
MEKAILQEIGLTANEADIYLILLRYKDLSVNDLALKAKMHRQTVYDALDRLLDKGFVTFHKVERSRHYRAVPPDRIDEYLHEKRAKFQAILPSLKRIDETKPDEFAVEEFQARNIVKIVYRDIVKELTKEKTDGIKHPEVVIFGTDESKFIAEDDIALQNQMKTLSELGMQERILIQRGDYNMVEGPQTRYRWMRRRYFSDVPTWVYRDSVTIVSWGNPHSGITIRNKRLADSHRKMFDLIWEQSKDPPKKKKS